MNDVETPGSRPDKTSETDTDGPAERALAEAEARRRKRVEVRRPIEIDGRSGPDPIRYGDWENKGIVSDF